MRSVSIAVFIAVVAATSGAAQGKPDFSGKWTPAQARGAMTVTQTDKSLTVERETGQGRLKTVYNLDGTETTSELRRSDGTRSTVTATARWDVERLVITTRSSGGEAVQTWSLKDGKLQIERPGRDGPVVTTYAKKEGVARRERLGPPWRIESRIRQNLLERAFQPTSRPRAIASSRVRLCARP